MSNEKNFLNIFLKILQILFNQVNNTVKDIFFFFLIIFTCLCFLDIFLPRLKPAPVVKYQI